MRNCLIIALCLTFVFTIMSYSTNKTSIDLLLDRISKNTNTQIITETQNGNAGTDFFEIEGKDAKIIVKGNNEVSIATGINWYLKYNAGIHISWNNLTQQLPKDLPIPNEKIRHETNQTIRYYLNYCTFSYSMAFWNWERWEKEIDWMALHGINMSLSITGNEVVWYNLLKRIGYTTNEVNDFISGPAFKPWWQMNNLEGWGGPNPDEWYQQQENLQKKIIARMKELGIEPVLPGYAGMVPRNIGEKLGYQITDPGTWCSFNRPAFLSPEDPNFNTFADMYYEELEKLYGKVKYYSLDPFHEGGSTNNVNLREAGNTMMAALKRANSEAVWVMQAWQSNPKEVLISDFKKHDLLILDLNSEKRPQWGEKESEWYRPNGYGKHDWIYCMLLNFGGRVGLHGKMDRLINSYYNASNQKIGINLRGVGVTAEGIENNPVMYELLYELPWRKERFTKEEWLESYMKARYGSSNNILKEAWRLLAESSYACPDNYPGEGAIESLFCARPSLHASKVSTWGNSLMYYDTDMTHRAAELILSVADQYKNNNNFQYDLVDVLRQSIADKGNTLSNKFSEAYDRKNLKEFVILKDSFLLLIKLQDNLLATRPEFKLVTWLEQAKSLSKNKKNKQLYEWNARTLITVWGNRPASEEGGLHDYSHREWSGLLSDVYYKQWNMFFNNKVNELKGIKAQPIDYFKLEEKWTYQNNVYKNAHKDKVIRTARKVYRQVFSN